jgi:hypothetical protein
MPMQMQMQMQTIPVIPSTASRDCQLMMMLFAQEMERNNQKFQEYDRRMNQTIQESDRRRSNDLLLQSMGIIGASNK